MSTLKLPLYSRPLCCSLSLAAPTTPALCGIRSPCQAPFQPCSVPASYQERGLDTHRTFLSPPWLRRQVPLAHTLSLLRKPGPLSKPARGHIVPSPFKNKHSLWLKLALTLERRVPSKNLCQSFLCNTQRREQAEKKGFYLSGCLTSREGILLFLPSNTGAALKNIFNLPD